MQHEATFHLHGPAKHHRIARHAATMQVDFEGQVQALKEHIRGQVGGAIDDDTKSATGVVLADIDDGTAENGIEHRRHRDEEMIGQIEGRRPGRCAG